MSDEIGNIGDAEALLREAILQDHPDPAATPPAPEPAAEATPEPQVTPDQPVEAPDLFADADIDLNNLSPAEELRIRQMQAHFTRKTQEAAESRREAEESLAFVQSLQNDPQFALQVHQELAQALEQAGLTPAQAQQAAANQVQTQMNAEPDFQDPDPFDEADYWENEKTVDRVSPEIQKQLNELQAWKAEQQAESERRFYADQLKTQEHQIRQQNPHYTQDDVDAIYERAFAYGGDLEAAHQSFEAERNRIIMHYLQQKKSVPAGSPQSSAAAQPVQEGFGPDLNAAHKAALEHLRQMEAEGLV